MIHDINIITEFLEQHGGNFFLAKGLSDSKGPVAVVTCDLGQFFGKGDTFEIAMGDVIQKLPLTSGS